MVYIMCLMYLYSRIIIGYIGKACLPFDLWIPMYDCFLFLLFFVVFWLFIPDDAFILHNSHWKQESALIISICICLSILHHHLCTAYKNQLLHGRLCSDKIFNVMNLHYFRQWWKGVASSTLESMSLNFGIWGEFIYMHFFSQFLFWLIVSLRWM